MYYGAGEIFFATKDLDGSSIRGENLMLPGCVASFSLTFEDNFIQAKCLEGGARVVKASQITESIPNLNLTFELQDWPTTQLIYDEIAVDIASVDLPELRVQTTDGSGILTDADIDGGDVINVDIFFYNPATTEWLLASDGVVAAGQVTFASLPNTLLQYAIFVTKTNVASIGVASNFDKFGRLLFNGRIYGTEEVPNDSTQLVINQMNRIASPELTINGDLNELSIDYQPEVSAGKRKEVEFYNLAA